MRKYNTLRNYKNFKKVYREFVVFIKNGNYLCTYDSDARILMYLNKDYSETLKYSILKIDFKKIIKTLHDNNLNVVLCGYKKSSEYYTSLISKYDEKVKVSKEWYKNERYK